MFGFYVCHVWIVFPVVVLFFVPSLTLIRMLMDALCPNVVTIKESL